MLFFFFFKQKTAYEMRISDWSSDVCSSDLALSLLGCLVDVREIDRRAKNLGDGSRQRGLAVVDVTDGADVAVRFGPLEFCLRHFSINLCLDKNHSCGRRADRKSTRLNSSH